MYPGEYADHGAADALFALAEGAPAAPDGADVFGTQPVAPEAEAGPLPLPAEAENAPQARAPAGAGATGAAQSAKPTPQDLLAAARTIVPGMDQYDIKVWPKGRLRPDANAMKVELARRLGGATQYGRKQIKNMLIPELCTALHQTPLEKPAGGGGQRR